MNSGDLQARINPHSSKKAVDFSDAKVKGANDVGADENSGGKTSFKDLIMNANADQSRARAAQKNGNEMSKARSNAEFEEAMKNKLNAQNARKPGNQLDKDAFLKLFITQVQNQDPLNPDDSSQMAAQLAQFDGLEQMMNVNKNLEKMAADNASTRAVSLINFVGKDLKLDGGKMKFAEGKLTDSSFSLDKDAAKATLEVRDAAGVVVATQDLGQVSGGDHKLEFNGVGKEGQKVTDGVYTFAVVAKDINGGDVDARITSNVKVTGVDLKDAGGAFYTDIGKVGVAEVSSVGDKGFVRRAAAGDAVPGIASAGGDGPSPEDLAQIQQILAQQAQAAGETLGGGDEAQRRALMAAAMGASAAMAPMAGGNEAGGEQGRQGAGAAPGATESAKAPVSAPNSIFGGPAPGAKPSTPQIAPKIGKPTLSAGGAIEISVPKS